jgi:hypothetical protein
MSVRAALIGLLLLTATARAAPPRCSNDGECIVEVVDAAGQKTIEKLRRKEHLRLVVLHPTPEGLRSLARVPWITALEIRAYVDDLAPIAKLTALRELQLIGVRAKTLAPLAALHALYSLQIGLCLGTTDTDFSFLASARDLHVLRVASCPSFISAAPLGTLPLDDLELVNTSIHDLAGLAGSPVGKLSIQHGLPDASGLGKLERLADLALIAIEAKAVPPLTTKWLAHASFSDSKALTDIGGLAGQKKLADLDLRGTAVADLRPLADAQALVGLSLARSRVVDLSPLKTAKSLSVIVVGDEDAAAMKAAFGKLRPDVAVRSESEVHKGTLGPR